MGIRYWNTKKVFKYSTTLFLITKRSGLKVIRDVVLYCIIHALTYEITMFIFTSLRECTRDTATDVLTVRQLVSELVSWQRSCTAPKRLNQSRRNMLFGIAIPNENLKF